MARYFNPETGQVEEVDEASGAEPTAKTPSAATYIDPSTGEVVHGVDELPDAGDPYAGFNKEMKDQGDYAAAHPSPPNLLQRVVTDSAESILPMAIGGLATGAAAVGTEGLSLPASAAIYGGTNLAVRGAQTGVKNWMQGKDASWSDVWEAGKGAAMDTVLGGAKGAQMLGKSMIEDGGAAFAARRGEGILSMVPTKGLGKEGEAASYDLRHAMGREGVPDHVVGQQVGKDAADMDEVFKAMTDAKKKVFDARAAVLQKIGVKDPEIAVLSPSADYARISQLKPQGLLDYRDRIADIARNPDPTIGGALAQRQELDAIRKQLGGFSEDNLTGDLKGLKTELLDNAASLREQATNAYYQAGEQALKDNGMDPTILRTLDQQMNQFIPAEKVLEANNKYLTESIGDSVTDIDKKAPDFLSGTWDKAKSLVFGDTQKRSKVDMLDVMEKQQLNNYQRYLGGMGPVFTEKMSGGFKPQDIAAALRFGFANDAIKQLSRGAMYPLSPDIALAADQMGGQTADMYVQRLSDPTQQKQALIELGQSRPEIFPPSTEGYKTIVDGSFGSPVELDTHIRNLVGQKFESAADEAKTMGVALSGKYQAQPIKRPPPMPTPAPAPTPGMSALTGHSQGSIFGQGIGQPDAKGTPMTALLPMDFDSLRLRGGYGN